MGIPLAAVQYNMLLVFEWLQIIDRDRMTQTTGRIRSCLKPWLPSVDLAPSIPIQTFKDSCSQTTSPPCSVTLSLFPRLNTSYVTMASLETTTAKAPSSPLEALNTDCLTAILSASNSLSDLGAFIRASPVVFSAFRSTKGWILRCIITKELGPAIRDALVLSLPHNIDTNSSRGVVTTLNIAVRGYRERLQVDKPPWVRALDDDEIHDMARITRIVLYLADLYIHIRIRHFRQVLDPPCAEWGVSPTERRRIAQALLRFGVLASLHGSELAFLAEETAIHFFTCMVDLFESWELEQVTEMGHFMVRLVRFFQPLDKHPPCCDNVLHYYAHYTLNLVGFGSRLIEALGSDDELLEKLLADPGLCNGKIVGAGWLPVKGLEGSHGWLWRPRGPLSLIHI